MWIVDGAPEATHSPSAVCTFGTCAYMSIRAKSKPSKLKLQKRVFVCNVEMSAILFSYPAKEDNLRRSVGFEELVHLRHDRLRPAGNHNV
eukprot:9489120-Pyramimonas_sp.AAC.1